MFLKVNNLAVNPDEICHLDCNNLENACQVVIHLRCGLSETVTGQPAIDLIMTLCPQMIEGKHMKFHRNRWALHNLVGHSVLQLLSWAGYHKLGFWVHDHTVPRPLNR